MAYFVGPLSNCDCITCISNGSRQCVLHIIMRGPGGVLNIDTICNGTKCVRLPLIQDSSYIKVPKHLPRFRVVTSPMSLRWEYRYQSIALVLAKPMRFVDLCGVSHRLMNAARTHVSTTLIEVSLHSDTRLPWNSQAAVSHSGSMPAAANATNSLPRRPEPRLLQGVTSWRTTTQVIY
jgi:hypothetical protein